MGRARQRTSIQSRTLQTGQASAWPYSAAFTDRSRYLLITLPRRSAVATAIALDAQRGGHLGCPRRTAYRELPRCGFWNPELCSRRAPLGLLGVIWCAVAAAQLGRRGLAASLGPSDSIPATATFGERALGPRCGT